MGYTKERNRWVKNCFRGTFDDFFRERRRLPPKIKITFFITNVIGNILLFSGFFKKSCIFRENDKKPFLGDKRLLTGRGCLATKME